MSRESSHTLGLCVPYILERLKLHHDQSSDAKPAPFFLGVNGVQGIGKSFLVSSIADSLAQAPYNICTIVLSIDDFYLSHEDQLRLAAEHPCNPLVQHRGQPSTHDLPLARSVVASLRAGHETSIPSYDKSAFNGQGDRKTQAQWAKVNANSQQPVELVVLEGWCLGFRALDDAHVTACWTHAANRCAQGSGYWGRLGHNRLEDVHFINRALRAYDVLTDQLDALIHLDAEDPRYAYGWRLEQEAQLRKDKGSGMTDEEVMNFVNGYYPSYELYTGQLRAGAFRSRKGAQLRLKIRKDRVVNEVLQL
ncbi:MAG: hypothetical protein L6R40_007295 [Gallowayella cf. fulva]|nr:MAG: hypothetical protein L6R40_007295 [Xanthomendoza cf. fulva]